MIILEAIPEDAASILKLQYQAYQIEAERYNDFELPPLKQSVEDIEKDINSQTVLKALVNEDIIGSVRAFEKDGTCHIGKLIVNPDYRRQGIARRLMHEIENLFSHSSRLELFTGHLSEPALNLYDSLGYNLFKEIQMDTHDLVFLEKRNGSI